MLLSMCVEGCEHITDGETSRVGIGQDAGNECAEPAFVLLWRVRLRGRRADERPHAAARLDDAGAFELGIDPCDGVGIDLEIHRELPHRRQLVSGTDPPRGNRGPEPAFELGVNRRPVARIDGDDIHVTYCTSSLEQLRQVKLLRGTFCPLRFAADAGPWRAKP